MLLIQELFAPELIGLEAKMIAIYSAVYCKFHIFAYF